MMKSCISWASVLSMIAVPLSAQQRDAANPSGVFARETQQRWLYGRQHAAFTPMSASAQSVSIVGVERDTANRTRTLSLTFQSDAARSGTARLTTDDFGHVMRIAASFAARTRRTDRGPPLVAAAEEQRWAIFDGVEPRFASLPDSRVWDLVPVSGATPLTVGSQWRDTLNLSASLDQYRQALHGIRESTIVGDTLVRGARLWIVRDSASVRYEEHLVVDERTLDTLAVVDRSADGTIIGRHLLDPTLGLDRVRVDTTALNGVAVLHYPDGRSFRTPARYERTQRIELMDETAYRARVRRRNAARGEFSIVIRPEGGAERIASGDTSYIDALLDTVTVSRDPDARARVVDMLRFAPGATIAARLRASMLRSGDTAAVVQALENAWVDRGQPIDENDFAVLLAVMVDPGVAFAFGLERDPLYENARQGLLAHPPAITPDTSEWSCVPSACRALAAQWTAGGDRRLRSLALIARLTMDPKRWTDTVLTRFSDGDRFLGPAVTLIRGVAASWPAGSHSPLPARGSDWHAWSNWMNGRNPAYSYMGPSQLVRFDENHEQAIGFARVLTGRDFAAEWRDGMRAATGDSARFVFGSMLAGIDASLDDVDAIAARLQSKSPLMRALALRELPALFGGGAAVSDSAITAEVQDRVLAVAIDGAPAWPTLDSALQAPGRGSPMPTKLVSAADFAYERPAATPGPLVLRGDRLAPEVRARWERRNVRIVDAHWRPKSSESVIIVTVSGVRHTGPFARVSIEHEHLTARVNGRGQSWASGTTLYLMRRGLKWFIVSADSWIT